MNSLHRHGCNTRGKHAISSQPLNEQSGIQHTEPHWLYCHCKQNLCNKLYSFREKLTYP